MSVVFHSNGIQNTYLWIIHGLLSFVICGLCKLFIGHMSADNCLSVWGFICTYKSSLLLNLVSNDNRDEIMFVFCVEDIIHSFARQGSKFSVHDNTFSFGSNSGGKKLPRTE